jgi:hypothetical protein
MQRKVVSLNLLHLASQQSLCQRNLSHYSKNKTPVFPKEVCFYNYLYFSVILITNGGMR